MKKQLTILLAILLMLSITPAAYAGMGSGTAPPSDLKYLPYAEVGELSEGLASYFKLGTTADSYGFINTTGQVAIEAIYEDVKPFSEGLAAVKLNGKWGFIDKSGKEVIQPQYANAYTFSEGLAPVEKDGKVIYIDPTGKEVIQTAYKDVYIFHDGLAGVKENGKWGFIDKTGNLTIKPQYDDAYNFSEGVAAVEVNGKWGFIDTKGQFVIQPQYKHAHPLREGLAAVKTDDFWGFIDGTGRVVIKPQFPEVYTTFVEGLALVGKNVEILSAQGKEFKYIQNGYIDKNGKEVLGFEDDFSGSTFDQGIAVAADGGQGSFYFIRNPLLGSGSQPTVPTLPAKPAVPGTPDVREVHFITKEGGYVTVTNVVADEPIIDEGAGTGDVLFVANAPVSITVHGNDFKPLGKEAVLYLPEAKFINGTVEIGDVHDPIKLTNNTATLTKPGVYIVGGRFGAEFSADNTASFVIEVLGDSTTAPQLTSASAIPTASKVLVNGTETSFEAYNIDGNNYFKLRDLAKAVNGTAKNFEVGFDAGKNAINLTSGKAYTSVGGELAVSQSPTTKEAKPSSSKLYLDGHEVQLIVYNIDGNNYFKLRDIARVINFNVTFDIKSSTVGIDTLSVYKNE